MASTNLLGFVALGLAVIGLAAVILEAAVKHPATLVELVIDGRRAIVTDGWPAKGRAVIGYCEPKAAANAARRVAA